MTDAPKSAKRTRRGPSTTPDYDKLSLDQLRDQASQSLADFAMGKIDTDEMNARARKATKRARAIRQDGGGE
jgi:hypothetical protein